MQWIGSCRYKNLSDDLTLKSIIISSIASTATVCTTIYTLLVY